MLIGEVKIAEVIKTNLITSDYSVDGSPDIVVYSVKLADYDADLSKNPHTSHEIKIKRFKGSVALKVGDVIEESRADPLSRDSKRLMATITGVEIVTDEKHPNRIEKLYSVKTDLLKKSFTVYGDSEGDNIPSVGKKINLTLHIFDEDMYVLADEFPEPFDEYTELIK